MERRDFDYYEARAQDVKLEDITSCNGNASILQQLRRQCTSLYDISITDDDWGNFVIGEGEDLGWLGYFIGKSKCVNELTIYSSGEGQNTEAFIDGINRNQSIISLTICTDLGGPSFQYLCPFFRNNNRLAQLKLNFEVGLECAQSIAFALSESQCQSLTYLNLDGCNLGEEGFVGIATALRAYPQLRELNLENDNIGLMGAIALGDSMRGWGESNLKHLDLDGNAIGDQGLQALATAMTNTALEVLLLSNN